MLNQSMSQQVSQTVQERIDELVRRTWEKEEEEEGTSGW